jgi:hypothetical protein
MAWQCDTRRPLRGADTPARRAEFLKWRLGQLTALESKVRE